MFMKKIILFFLVAALSTTVFSQQTATPPLTKADYLQKSKSQTTIAYATSIPGALLLIIGGAMFFSEFDNGLPGGTGSDEKTINTGNILMIVGSGLMLVAIPFQLAARKNKKLGMEIGFKNEPTQQLQESSLFRKTVPSLSLKISL